jgi:hypothetical protein
MKKILVIFSLFIFSSAFADEVQYIDRENAVVRVMNKAAGKVHTTTLPVGRASMIEKMLVVVRACKQTAPYAAENFYMFAEIEKDGTQIFSGWLDRNEPGDNPLQDADYDLWLVECL